MHEGPNKKKDKAFLKKIGIDSVKVEGEKTGKIEKEPKFKVANDPEIIKLTGQHIFQVMGYVVRKYSGRIPNSKHVDYLIKNPDKVPEIVKDGNFYYFMGPEFEVEQQETRSDIMSVYFEDGKLYRAKAWVMDRWQGHDRVLLLDK